MHAGDARIAQMAAGQKDLVTVDALIDAQFSRSAIAHRVRTGRLHRVHHRVYTTQHAPLSYEQQALAAVLATSGTCALGDGWAAGLWLMMTEPPGPPEVRREGEHRTGPGGVIVRRAHRLEATVHRGIPVTTPAQTLLHLATTGTLGRLELALAQAQERRLVTRGEIEALAATSAKGAAPLRALLAEGPGYTRQELERRFRALVLRAQLTRPDFNARVEDYEVDAYWPRARLIVELDGWSTHGHHRAFERDRAKDARLVAAGYRVIRITWRQVTQEPEAVVARIAAALAGATAEPDRVAALPSRG